MALSQEELNKVKALKALGYNTNQIAGHLGGNRLGRTSFITEDLNKPEEGMEEDNSLRTKFFGGTKDIARRNFETVKDAPSDIAQGFTQGVQQFKQAGEDIVDTATDQELTIGEKIRGIGSRVFSGGARGIGEGVMALAKLPFSQKAEENIAGKVGEVAQDVVQSEPAQQAIAFYDSLPEDAKREVKNALGFAEGLAEIGGGRLAKEGVKQVGRFAGEAIDVVKKTVDDIKVPKREVFQGDFEQRSALGDVIEDVRPKANETRDRLLARSLKLAPVEDINNFKTIDGEDLGDFMGRYNLIGDTTDETVEGLANFQRANLDRISDAVSLVDETFNPSDVSGFPQTIEFLQKDLEGLNSQKFASVLERIEDIKNKPAVELSDILEVRKTADELTSFYKRSGEPKDARKAQDMVNNINELRRFLEVEVKAQYPDIDIKELNANIRKSKNLLDAIVKRSGKNDTESLFKLGDMAILGAGNVTAPGAGFAGLVGKKIFESPPIQLRLARKLDSMIDRSNTGKLTQQDLSEIDTLIQSELFKSLSPDVKKETIKIVDDLKSKQSLTK